MTDLTRDSSELRRGVAFSAVAQVGARGLHLLLNVVSTLVIIRYLSPSSYGNYVLVLVTSALVGLIADFGLSTLATREIARDPAAENEVLGTILVARLLLAGLCVGLLQLVLLAFHASLAIHLAGLISSFFYFGDAFMVSTVALYVRVRQQYQALLVAAMETFETALIIVLVAFHASVPLLFVPPTLSMLVGGALAFVMVHWRLGVCYRPTLARFPYLLRESLPLGPALLISVCYLKFDTLMLVLLGSRREVGLYGSAYQPIEYLFLATAVVVNVAFPLVAAAYSAGDRLRFAMLYRKGAEVLLASMAMVPVTLLVIAHPLVNAVYGTGYRQAVDPLQILAFTLMLMTLNVWQAFVLLSGGRQKATLLYNVGALAVAAIACLVLIQRYGIDGAAIATICTSGFVIGCSTIAVRRYFRIHLSVVPIIRIVAAAVALWAALWLLRRGGAPWWALVPAAAIVYPAALVAVGWLHVGDLRAALSKRSEEVNPAGRDLGIKPLAAGGDMTIVPGESSR